MESSSRNLLSIMARLLSSAVRMVLIVAALRPAAAQTTTPVTGSSGTIIPAPPIFIWPYGPIRSLPELGPQTQVRDIRREQDPTDPTHAYDSTTGQNLYWDPANQTWVDSATGENVGFDGVKTSSAGSSFRRRRSFMAMGYSLLLTGAGPQTSGHQAQQDPTDPTHAFDSTTGQNLYWDPDNNTWVDSTTGESLGFDGVLTTPPPSPPQMPGTTSMVTPGAQYWRLLPLSMATPPVWRASMAQCSSRSVTEFSSAPPPVTSGSTAQS